MRSRSGKRTSLSLQPTGGNAKGRPEERPHRVVCSPRQESQNVPETWATLDLSNHQQDWIRAMKSLSILLAVATSIVAVTASAADVGVSVAIGQPGFYGRLDIGGFPPPALVYPQPMIVERVPAGRPPVYLRVPPGHAKHWNKHCREYNACGVPVYFVKDDWYTREYVPRYQERYGSHGEGQRHDEGNHGKGGHGHGKGK